MNDELKNVIEKVKFRISDQIFFSGNYNTELYKYASEKVGYSNIHFCKSENSKKMPIEIKKVPSIVISQGNYEKNDYKSSIMLSLPLILISMSLIAFHYYWSGQHQGFFSEISR